MKLYNIIIISFLFIFAWSCTEDEITEYRGVDYVYFEDEIDDEGEFPSTYFTFLFEEEEIKTKTIKIPVLVSGK